ncbi:rhodanese-like domain-containing protein [Helicobacter anseris]|uniref:Rhodanese-like domain-containing protein n=1 Tax=Helicobacter anseris TaxID=375926 RepID=A0A3D8J748_9HELI|nr:rhodanese-like domain-containing protein [Helicobacter anseris]RDU73258.1 rhodanese-like domain-containing protein [Helicobacter anseris]
MQNTKDYALKFKQINLKDYIVIDIREKEDYKKFHIQNAIHLQDIRKIIALAEEKTNKNILLYCYHGNTASMYVHHLLNLGVENVYFLKENYEEFEEMGIPLIKS